MFNEQELAILEDLLNEEILSYLRSGYYLHDNYVVSLRAIIEKLGLKEIYNFSMWEDNE